MNNELILISYRDLGKEVFNIMIKFNVNKNNTKCKKELEDLLIKYTYALQNKSLKIMPHHAMIL